MVNIVFTKEEYEKEKTNLIRHGKAEGFEACLKCLEKFLKSRKQPLQYLKELHFLDADNHVLMGVLYENASEYFLE